MSDCWIHECVVCSTPITRHPQPAWTEAYYFSPPCCKGCPCGSYEEALANASPEEQAEERYREIMSRH